VDGRTVVRCELLSHAFGHTPPYLGLSYTWGDPTLRLLIAIGDRILSVTENLAVSLEHLQEEELTLVLWVDAVCIDQDNRDEKNIQAQRMGDIFSSAALVIAWLGVSADESDLAMEELEQFAETISTIDDLRQSDGQLFATLPLERTATEGLILVEIELLWLWRIGEAVGQRRLVSATLGAARHP
jgi:hypothetical protein